MAAESLSSNDRHGLTLVEVIVVIVLVVVVGALIVPSVFQAREVARRSTCKNNLKQIALVLHNYHDGELRFPAVVTADAALEHLNSGIPSLLFYTSLWSHRHHPTDYGTPWENYYPSDGERLFPMHLCPSYRGEDPAYNPYIDSLGHRIGGTFGVTTYVFSKGAGDAWCTDPWSVPDHERGAFDINFFTRFRDIFDGTSHTILMGEGDSGPAWAICEGLGCTEAAPKKWNPDGLLPGQPWIIGRINTEHDVATGYLAGSLLASTMEPMNKNPVTDTMIQSTAVDDCRSSTDGGPHRTSNFRSEHQGGGNFMFADGSVRFISQEIELPLYRRLSTIADGEGVPKVDRVLD